MTVNDRNTIPRNGVPMSSVFFAASAPDAPVVDMKDWDKLSPDQKAQQAWARFGAGDNRPEVVKYVEAGIPGANGDGVLDEKERKALDDMQKDKAFTDSLKNAAIVMAEVAATSVALDMAKPKSLSEIFMGYASGIILPEPEPGPKDSSPKAETTFGERLIADIAPLPPQFMQ